MRSGDFLQTQSREGSWTHVDLTATATEAIRKVGDVYSFQWVMNHRTAYSDQAIYADSGGRLYTLIQGGPTRLIPVKRLSYRPYVLYSSDSGSSWQAVALSVPDGRPTWRATMEHNDGNSDRSGPPPVLLFDLDDKAATRSANLYLATMAWKGDRLIAQSPVVLSDKSLLTENHSGAANSLASTDERVFVVYPGASNNATASAGTPAYLVVYNKKAAKLERETLLGAGGSARAVDSHNIPGICLGAKASVHVLLPGHQESLFMKSGALSPDGVIDWMPAQRIGEAATSAGGYTYASLNCDPDGNVSVVTRWAGDNYRFELVLLRRAPNGEWRSWNNRRHLLIVDPGRPYYGVWRHKVAQDRDGTLLLFYSYYANHLSREEFSTLKKRFPFEEWETAKEVVPPQCVRGSVRRCWVHPMPQVTRALLRGSALGEKWQFVE